MKYVLRATRYITALFVSSHVAALRGHVKLADRKATKAVSNTDYAKALLAASQDTVRIVREQVRESRAAEILAANDAKNTRIAADGEAKFWGREL